MRKGNLTREQAIEMSSQKLVEKVESLNCDFTNRLQTDGDDAIEFSAGINFIDSEGNKRILTAYYYQDPVEYEKIMEETGGDMGSLDWEINGYEIW